MKIIDRYKEKIKENETILMPLFLLLGFIVDWFTLNRVDQIFDNLVLLTYIILSGISIILMNSFFTNRLLNKLKDVSPYLLQYAFGGLFSGLVIFYFRSSHIITSLPFMIILLILFLGNDFLHRKYQRLVFQISVFYVAIFSYLNLIIPILFGMISGWIFLLSGILSLILIYGYIRLVNMIVINERFKYWSYRFVMIIFTTFIFLYSTNTIPPIPLSLKTSHVAHNIEVTDIGYEITLQKSPWYVFWNKYTNNINISNNQGVYVFSRVFAPTRFKSQIFHEWSYFDYDANRWKKTDLIPMTVIGGIEEGSAGYSIKNNIDIGTWRVDIKTETNQIIGRFIFKLKSFDENIDLTKVKK